MTEVSQPWHARRVMTFSGQRDTNIHNGTSYGTISLAEFFALGPADCPKESAPAFIPSSYCAFDGRKHVAQRERGSFVVLPGDVDKGDHPREVIEALVRGFCDDAAFKVYSSARSMPGDRKWRTVIPLAEPLPFQAWQEAQRAFFNYMERMGVQMDRSLRRAAQPVYLPNVPPVHNESGAALRGTDGEPLYFEQATSDTNSPGLRIDAGLIAEGIAEVRAADAAARAEAEARRADTGLSKDASGVIAAFNAKHPLEEMLEKHGYEHGGGDDWKSPMASSGFSTQISDDGQRWRSLSESDAAAGIGAASRSGDTRTGDAFDLYVHFEHKGDTTAALRQLHAEGINADERLGTPPPSLPAGAIPLPPPEAFTLADLTAWSRTAPRPKPFIMPGFIPARELTLATGAGGANKSTFGQQLATCCAAGIPMLGIDVMTVKALYITAEDDEDRLHWMQSHICNAVGVDIASLSGRLHLASLRGRLGNEIATFGLDGTLHPSASFALLRATIEQTQAGLVVLDNAAHLFVGNENDRQQVTAFVNLLYSLCRDLGATVILVAHTNKAGDSYSGSTAWLNAVRSQIILERPEGSPDPDERVLLLGKANYARQGQEVRFRWHDFALVRNEDLPPDQRAEIFATVKAAAVDERFLECLTKATQERRNVSVASSASNYAPKMFAKMAIGKPYTVHDYAEAMERLLHLSVIANHVRVFQRDNRQWVHGLGIVESCTNPCTDPAPSDAPTSTDQA